MFSRIFFIILFFICQSGFAQKSSTDSLSNPVSFKPAVKSAEWIKDAIIYCAYLRSFSQQGTFEALENRISELKELGVNVIWLMPIHPVGMKNRKGTLGNPYSVRDYYATNPEFGSMIDFQKLLSTVHKYKMKLIIDLVINHTSWDSKLIIQHPEWFTKDSLGNIVAPNSDWTDVADLDYSKTGLRKYMLEMMEWWVRDIGIDGFRCDVSELVPLDFWEEARKRLNNIKPIMMLSEGSLPEQHLNAFDITYSWNIYDALDPLLNGKYQATFLDSILIKEEHEFPINALRLRFNTNHDKNAWDNPAVIKFGLDGLKLSAILINTIPGIPLIYNGEEIANDKKLSLFEKVDIDWNRSREMDTLYRTLFKLRNDHKSIARGKFIKLTSSNDNAIYSYLRTDGSDKVMTIINFSGVQQTGSINISSESYFKTKQKYKLKEIFTKAFITIERGEDLSIDIPPHGSKIYLIDEK